MPVRLSTLPSRPCPLFFRDAPDVCRLGAIHQCPSEQSLALRRTRWFARHLIAAVRVRGTPVVLTVMRWWCRVKRASQFRRDEKIPSRGARVAVDTATSWVRSPCGYRNRSRLRGYEARQRDPEGVGAGRLGADGSDLRGDVVELDDLEGVYAAGMELHKVTWLHSR